MMSKCVHCGKELTAYDRHYNPWLSKPGEPAWECSLYGGAPSCKAGQKWYNDNTVVVDGIRLHRNDQKFKELVLDTE